MTDSDATPLATGPLGMRLLAFERVPETTRFTDPPVGYALVVLWHDGLLLLVHERVRDCWELPGGGIEPGESPRQAAVRELWEESGQRLTPEELRFVGFARTSLPHREMRYGAVYQANAVRRGTFEANSEISAIHWWDGRVAPPGGQVQTVNTFLATLAKP